MSPCARNRGIFCRICVPPCKKCIRCAILSGIWRWHDSCISLHWKDWRLPYIRKVFSLATAIIFVLCFQASAVGWRKLPLRGGSVQQLLPYRSAQGVWFAVNSDRLYRSSDSGLSWQQNPLQNVKQVVVDPSTAHIFAVTAIESRVQIQKSTNGGKTFVLQASIHGFLRHLVVHPDDSRTMYAFGIGNDDFAVSHDGGRHWSPLTFPDPNSLGCEGCYYNWNDLLISPQDHKTLYLSGGFFEGDPPRSAGGLLSISLDSGKTWKTTRQSQMTFYTDPAYPERAFAYNIHGLMQLKGNRLQVVSHLSLQQIASVPGIRNLLYGLHPIKAGARIVRSTDSGKSWIALSESLSNSATRLAAGVGDLLLAGTDGAGVFRKNKSQAWQPSSDGFKDAFVSALTVSGSTVYTMSALGPWTFRSTDTGESWVVRHVPKLTDIFANPGNPTHLIGITLDGNLALSRDGGDSWSASHGLPEDNYYALAFDPSNQETVYLAGGIDPVKIYRSTDGGNNFERSPVKFPSAVFSIQKIIVDRSNSQVVYFLTTDGVYKSTDAGSTAQKANSGVRCSRCPANAYSLVPLSQPNSWLLSMDDGGLFRTDNGGSSWVKAGTLPGFFISQMVSAGQDGTHLFALSQNTDTFNTELLESTNGGQNWNRVGGINSDAIDLMRLSEAGGPVYLSTDQGLFRSP